MTDFITIDVDTSGFLRRADEVVGLYDRVFTAAPWHDDPADTAVFADRLSADAARPGFRAAYATDADGKLAGFGFGYLTTLPFPDEGAYPLVAELLGPRRLDGLAGALEIRELAVDASARRHGTGRRLINAVRADCRAWLITRLKVTEAVAFYERLGWSAEGTFGGVILFQSPAPARPEV